MDMSSTRKSTYIKFTTVKSICSCIFQWIMVDIKSLDSLKYIQI